MRKSFIPAVKADTVTRIKAASADTCFIMEQRQPAEMWDPEDNLDLVPYSIWSRGTEEQVMRYWKSLTGKIQRAHSRESVEIFSKTEGIGFYGITILKGSEVITYIACGKDKALQLAL